MATDIDYDKIQRNLAVLMKNSVALSNKFYDLFVNTTPMDIELRVWTSENTFETITIPNLAKGSIPARVGEGNPESKEDASYGTIYLDEETGTVYIKTTPSGILTGWHKIVTSKELVAHDQSPLAHQGTLAQINGDENQVFRTADLDPEETDNGYYAVNKNSLYVLLGGLENLDTEDKSDIVSAINETNLNSHRELGCIVRGNVKDSLTGASAILTQKVTNNGMTLQLTVGSGIVALTASGEQITITKNVLLTDENGEIILIDNLVSEDGRFSIYLDCTNREDLKLVALDGDYYVSPTRPAFLGESDCWMNIGSSPYNISTMQAIGDELKLVEKDYIFLGIVEVQIDG